MKKWDVTDWVLYLSTVMLLVANEVTIVACILSGYGVVYLRQVFFE